MSVYFVVVGCSTLLFLALPGHPTQLNYTQEIHRESACWDCRAKELRLNNIKTQILSYLGRLGNSTGNSTSGYPNDPLLADVYKQHLELGHLPPPTSDIYTKKVQSFYPSCEVPRNTEEEVWKRGDPMNLHFEINLTPSAPSRSTHILAAKLRLYRLAQVETGPSEKSDPLSVDERQVRVSVYWYTRPLKKNRVGSVPGKRRLLDSQMVAVERGGDSWTEWNVRQAVRAWATTQRNFGLGIETEDEEGLILSTHQYFAPMNCKNIPGLSRPMPGFLVDAASKMVSDNATRSRMGLESGVVVPSLDVWTVEMGTPPPPEAPDSIEQISWQDPTHQFTLQFNNT